MPISTGIMWVIGLVLLGLNTTETVAIYSGFVVLGIHFGYAVTRRDNVSTTQTAQGAGTTSAPSHLHDRRKADRGIRWATIGRKQIPGLRPRTAGPVHTAQRPVRLRIGLAERPTDREVAEPTKVGGIHEFDRLPVR